MIHLRITSPAALTEEVVRCLDDDPAVSSLVRVPGAALRPPGDLVLADVAREASSDVVARLRDIGVQHEGTLQVEPVRTWLSRRGLEAERDAPGSSADAVVWADVVQRSYEESELNWTFLSFMVLATLIAAVAIAIDSTILVIGAMVLGPEFGAVAALGVALVRRRRSLLRLAVRTLLTGFAVAITVTALAGVAWAALGWVTEADLVDHRTSTSFVYSPDKWSVMVAIVAGAAGVLSMTSARVSGLSGVFISVTTIPAAGNVGLGLALGLWSEVWGSTAQLAINLVGMAVAGWLTLVVQQFVWTRIALRRRHPLDGLHERP
jgi:uncharacterized hydrophobic protein (TIGR00271 family)